MFSTLRPALLVCAATTLAGAAAPAPQARAAMAQLPLRFESNHGQFSPGVRYAARTHGYTLQLTDRGAAISQGASQPVGISLVKSNAQAKIEALDKLPVRTDYFVGSRDQWHTGVDSYARVRYSGVYPGVDVVYYGNHNQLEYDFVLQPGADPKTIRLRFQGAHGLAITLEGDVAFDSETGRIVQKKPIIYQQDANGARREVSGRYVMVARNTVGLKLDGYDRKRQLVIDPVLVYSSLLGGPETDQINAVRLGPKNLLYVTGSTDTTGSDHTNDLPPTEGAYAGASAGLTDIFLAVFDLSTPDAYKLVYFTYLGGTNLDIALAMQVDAAGRAYLTGSTTSSNFPVVGNAVATTGAATFTYAFVSIIDPNASGTDALPYSTYLGGATGTNAGKGIDVDSKGNIYVIGTTRATDFPVSSSPYQAVLWGPQDIFLCKIDTSTSTMPYSTYLGGESTDEGRSIAVTPGGLVYFAADTVSLQIPQAGNQYRPTISGTSDGVIGVMDMTKTGFDALIYSTYFGGSAQDAIRSIRLDAKGNLLVTGYTLSSDFPVTGDAAQSTYAGNGDAFVSVVNPNAPGFVLYSTFLGGSEGEVGYDVAGDSAGNIYVTGYTLSPNFPVQDAIQSDWGQGIDVFVTEIKPGVPGRTALVYSTYMGGATVNVGNALAVGTDGRVYVVGYTGGVFPLTDGALQGYFGGGYTDGFISVLQGAAPVATPKNRAPTNRLH